MIWIVVIGLVVMVVEGIRFSRIEKIQLRCNESMHELRAHHDELMRQTRKKLEGEYSQRIEGLQLQLANRDEVVGQLEATLEEGRKIWEASIKTYSEEIQVLNQELALLHESDAATRAKLVHAEQQREKLLGQIRKARTLLEC